MKVEKEERYRARTKKVEAHLIEFGISSCLAKNLTYSHPIGVLERLVKATEKRQPGKPAAYFLNGLKKSTVKHRLERGVIRDEDVNSDDNNEVR